jgi:AcrR family transcriptional regulator
MRMGKGAQTREKILDAAFRLAARDGLEGLSLSQLAGQLGVSKSGLFAHFRSKEDLQLETLKAGATRFEEAVVRPAFVEPRGLPRLRRLFDNWVRWSKDPSLPGGCLLMAAATEFDDREGPVRDYLVAVERQLLGSLARSARIAVEEGHFHRDLDCDQFAFELNAIVLGFNYTRRLLRDPKAERQSRAAFERLVRTAETA